MNKKFVLSTLLCFTMLIFGTSYADNNQSRFNLAGLKSISVKVAAKGLLSEEMLTRLRTDVQLKIRSAGLELKSAPENGTGILLILAHGLKGFASSPISVQLNLVEKVKVNRAAKGDAIAITFQYEKMAKMIDPNKEIYNIVMTKLLPKFIEQYLSQNT